MHAVNAVIDTVEGCIEYCKHKPGAGAAVYHAKGNYRHARCCVALFQRKSLAWLGDDDLYLPFDHYALYLLCLDAFRVGALLRQMRA